VCICTRHMMIHSSKVADFDSPQFIYITGRPWLLHQPGWPLFRDILQEWAISALLSGPSWCATYLLRNTVGRSAFPDGSPKAHQSLLGRCRHCCTISSKVIFLEPPPPPHAHPGYPRPNYQTKLIIHLACSLGSSKSQHADGASEPHAGASTYSLTAQGTA